MTAGISFGDLLAEETWDHCWSFSARLDLHYLSLVNRQFRRICQARLFRSIQLHHVDVEAATSNSAGRRREEILVLRQIESTKALAASPHAVSVRELSLGNPKLLLGGGDLFKLFEEFIVTFTTTLGCYANLTTLSLCWLDIDTALRESLESLHKLTTLSLSFCRPDYPLSTPRGAHRTLPLTSLSITTESPSERIDVGVPQQLALTDLSALRHLSLDPAAGDGLLEFLCSTDPAELRRLTSLALEHIEWRPAELRRVLELFPGLHDLAIDIHCDTGTAATYAEFLDTMPLTMLSELKSLRCRTELVAALVRGRPVAEIVIPLNLHDLTEPGTDADSETLSNITPVVCAVRAMSLSSASVRRLSIKHILPLKEEQLVVLFAALRENLPEIESLSLDMFDYGRHLSWLGLDGGTQESVTELLARLVPTHQLDLPRTLHTFYSNCYQPFCQISVPEEHAAILDLEVAMPSLCVVSLCDCHAKARGEDQTKAWSWVRDRNVWSKRIAPGEDDYDGGGGGGGGGGGEWVPSLVSRVWKEDGTRLSGF
ncbi:hypothetical protein C8F01DRAFT_268022 [Mycena amicta]|nr:hypothetical protein C8F01DRAFT_268022 [Mycena amicta]